jgi:ABC-type nitrate/sulfonate/bicarbonate transport system permease component
MIRENPLSTIFWLTNNYLWLVVGGIGYLVIHQKVHSDSFSLFVDPVLVVNRCLEMGITDQLKWAHYTFLNTLVAFGIGFSVALFLLLISSSHQVPFKFFSTTSKITKNYPAISFFPFFSFSLGLGIWPQILVAAVAGLLPKLHGVLEVMETGDTRIEYFSRYKIGILKRFTQLILPELLSVIFSFSGSSMAMCYVVIIILEMTSTTYNGLGYGLVLAKNNLDSPAMWVWLIWIGIIGFLLQEILRLARKIFG